MNYMSHNLAARNTLFSDHVYHTLHHVFTTKEPQEIVSFPQIPQKTTTSS